MPRLYIANCTRQNRVINYRLDYHPEQGKRRFTPARSQTVQPGQQINLGGDLNIGQIEDVIDQLNKLGMVGAVEVKRAKGGNPIPFVFSIDKAIPRPIIEEVLSHNRGALILSGERRRQLAAIAGNEALINKIGQMTDPVAAPDEFVVEYEQQETTVDGDKRIEQGFRVQNRADAGAQPAAPRKRTGTSRRRTAKA